MFLYLTQVLNNISLSCLEKGNQNWIEFHKTKFLLAKQQHIKTANIETKFYF